jgi:hypothetical protein
VRNLQPIILPTRFWRNTRLIATHGRPDAACGNPCANACLTSVLGIEARPRTVRTPAARRRTRILPNVIAGERPGLGPVSGRGISRYIAGRAIDAVGRIDSTAIFKASTSNGDHRDTDAEHPITSAKRRHAVGLVQRKAVLVSNS